jgi:hypothetical protein
MNKLLEKPIVKSLIRGLLIAVNAVLAASETYAAQGNSVGLNLATVLGVAWTLAGVGLAILQRYYDETDPAFGRLAKPVFVMADKVVAKKTAVKRAPKKVAETPSGGKGIASVE